mmetsp:Transcript_32675/g.54742  ORF Transcript_32675/g.54742 Transcript_32675/m.54742 type:complete len:271 (-) Transcript_32675:692-1504(-)
MIRIHTLFFLAFSSSALLLQLHVARGFSKNNIVYRQGQKSDQLQIVTTLAKEFMNPLGIDTDRFIVATTNDAIIGWAQTKPLGQAASRDPSSYNSRPGSYDLEKDVDDAMWEDFENDNSIQVPVGLASLPWTKEYRAMERAVQNRDTKREQIRARQQQDLDLLQLWELSSVYVLKEYRRKGIGTELVRRVLRDRLEKKTLPTSIYLLTLKTTTDWYREKFAFEEVTGTDIPGSMALEVTAGNFLTKMMGAQLCCMRGTSKTPELCKAAFS